MSKTILLIGTIKMKDKFNILFNNYNIYKKDLNNNLIYKSIHINNLIRKKNNNLLNNLEGFILLSNKKIIIEIENIIFNNIIHIIIKNDCIKNIIKNNEICKIFINYSPNIEYLWTKKIYELINKLNSKKKIIKKMLNINLSDYKYINTIEYNTNINMNQINDLKILLSNYRIRNLINKKLNIQYSNDSDLLKILINNNILKKI